MSTWLFGICRCVASDYRRSAPIRREIVTDVAAMDLPSEHYHHDGPLLGSESRQRAILAETILNGLPEAQRVVFVLFELEEMSGEDIAALLNISVGTVRSRLRLARERFRREVKRLAAMAGRAPQASGLANSAGRKEAV